MNKHLLSFVALMGLGMCANATEAVEVLQSRNLADGVTQQMVKNEKGQLYRRYVGVNAPKSAQSNAEGTASDNATQLFFESFEGFATEGKDLNWIPSTWSKIIAPGNEPTADMISHNINNSWYCYYTGDGKFTPQSPDGECDAFIHFGYENKQYNVKPVAQDEWLITPTIQMKESGEHYLDFLLAASYFDCYDVSNDFDWTSMTFSKRVKVNTMKVMATTDNGTTWQQVFDLVDDVAAYKTDRECYDTEFTTYLRYQVDVSELTGKSVKFAFRYTRNEGDWVGNSMAVDAVKVLHKEASSVNDVKKAGATVTKNGNVFTVCGDAKAVDVYNVAGQKMASVALPTNGTIDASAWASGIYIFRFSDGSAVKVAK